MLIAEDLMLLLLDDADGKPVVDGTAVDHALAGAVLAELVEGGHVEDLDPGRWSRHRRLVRRDGAVLSDELLAGRLARLDRPRTGSAGVSRLTSGLRAELVARLVRSGHLLEERRRVLGLFPVTRFPGTDPAHEAGVRAGLGQVIREGRRPTPREAVLLALLDAVDGLPKVLPAETAGLGKAELAARVDAVGGDEAVPAAVRKAVQDARAAMQVAIMTATTTTVATGSS